MQIKVLECVRIKKPSFSPMCGTPDDGEHYAHNSHSFEVLFLGSQGHLQVGA